MKYFNLLALIFLVLITKAQTTDQPKADASVPMYVQKWLTEKTAFKKRKAIQKGFFLRDSIKIVGYIKGYDKNAKYSSGIIYHGNNITREDLPTIVRIYKDGRFECGLPAIHPMSSSIHFNDQSIKFYAEPGTTTGIILGDKTTEYLGVNKAINDQLAAIEPPRPDYNNLDEYRKTQTPNDFKQAQLRNWESTREKVDSTMEVKQTSERVRKLVANQVDLTYAVYLFDYEMSRTYYQKQAPDNEILKLPMPENYFDFLSKIDLDDQLLLVSNDFSTFVNRFEFSPVFERKILFQNQKTKGFLKLDSAYLSKNKKVNLVYDIAKLRSLTSDFKFYEYKKRSFAQETTDLLKTVQEPFLLREMDRMYDKYKIGNVAYDLPNTTAAAVFKKIINPIKGKVLIVDFWAENCGPCRAGIESSLEFRKKYKDNPDFDFVYVTDSENTGAAFYDDYIKKNLMLNTHRITADEYLALRELFRFNGIPRYVLVTEEGKIQDDNFASYNMKSEFQKYFPGKFPIDYWK
ncbi:TlpA disulfide reductase family protein [Pedobacter panaciterrae]|uniref:TlpA disulfide reductase family protein n=1 Tax=Pedobacter panaciterrae TaxID=363849 RepID=A0ABU8NJ95_9SPHI